MKANFDEKQPTVKMIIDGDKIYIFICVNGEWSERQYDESQEPQKVWECDYREIITTVDKIDVDKVKANPEMYLNWVEPIEKSDSDKIADLKEQNRMHTQCLMEMSEIVYA